MRSVKLDLYKRVSVESLDGNHIVLSIGIDSVRDSTVADFFQELMWSEDLIYFEEVLYIVTGTEIHDNRIIIYGEEKIW